jgi:hypothetical protein
MGRGTYLPAGSLKSFFRLFRLYRSSVGPSTSSECIALAISSTLRTGHGVSD